MSDELIRTVGQHPMLPGSVVAGGLVFTSGLLSQAAFDTEETGVAIDPDVQVAHALEELKNTLEKAGTNLQRTVRIEAFVSSGSMLDGWNRQFLEIWPVPGPARMTTVAKFAKPGIDFELLAIAAL